MKVSNITWVDIGARNERTYRLDGPVLVSVAFGSGFIREGEETEKILCGAVIELGEGESASFASQQDTLGPNSLGYKFGMRLMIMS